MKKHLIKTHLQFRTLISAPIHQNSRQTSEINPTTIDSVRSISLNPCFSLLGLCKNACSLKNIHASLVVHGHTDDLLCQTKLVSLYGLFGNVKSARMVFDQIPNPDFFSFKVMIRCYFINDLYNEIIGVYTCLRQCLKEHDNIVISIALKACNELRDFHEGRKIHTQIIKVGNPDSFVLTGLVDMYAKCGEMEYSCEIFDQIKDRNVVCWTSMIVGYVHNECPKEGLILFNKMRAGLVQGNQYTLGSLVTACTKLGAFHQGKWVHGYVIKYGIDLNSYLITNLVDMYAKFEAIMDARTIFNELQIDDVVPWTAMIFGYTQSGCPDQALKLFKDKNSKTLLPNFATIASVLSACAKSKNLELGRLVHCLGIKLGLEDATVINTLLDMYAKCHVMKEANYLFDMVSDKDVISWNSIMSGYSLNGYSYEALRLFNRMRFENFEPDEVTLVIVLSVSASIGSLQIGSSLHAYATKRGFLSSNVYVGTSLLNLYAKCSDSKSARAIFDSMGEKNEITWNAMIGGYGKQGDCSVSLSLFNDMMNENLEPNDAIFTTILSACSHAGMVEEGWKCFNSMCREYEFAPKMKHYVCMVDLLARAGKLEEALDFIDQIPVQPDVSLYAAFLHGCSLHSRLDLGEIAVSRMLELFPDDASYYVLISKFFGSDGRWNQVYRVRELMKKRGLIKSPGCSSQTKIES